MKVFPSPKRPCPCKILRTSAIPYRLLGRFPYSWKHTNGRCLYAVSVPWALYSVAILVVLATLLWHIVPLLQFHIGNLPMFLDSLINICKMMYVFITVLHWVNVKVWIRLAATLRNRLLCKKSKGAVKRFQKIIFLMIYGVFVLQNVLFVVLKLEIDPGLPLHVIFFRNLQFLASLTYAFWVSCIRYCISMFVCFENVVVNCLNYKRVHPIKDLDFTHNKYVFMGFHGGAICGEEHFVPERLRKLSRVQVLEYLRITHEEAYQIVYLLQDFASPQLVLYILVDAAVIIVTLYSIIVYLLYEFQSATSHCLFILNCTSVVWYGLGIYTLAQNIHALKKIVHGLKPILMECAMKARTPNEHQQIRMFINKITNQQPFTASGFFEVDLGIIGPVLGSVLTYLLVALQYEIPPQHEK